MGKAIRDGVIEGRIVHEKGWMECGTQKGGYGPEVSEVFSRRIGFCLELHNQSIKVCIPNSRFSYDVDVLYVRQCVTPSTHIVRNLLQQRGHVNEKKSLSRRFRKEILTMTPSEAEEDLHLNFEIDV